MPSLTFELCVEMEGGTTFQVIADQRDIARWEIQPFGWPVSQMEERVSMAFFRYLAWSAAHRQQLTALQWPEFDAACIEAMPPDDEEGEGTAPADAGDPGRPAPSATPSSSSRGKQGKR